jgi:hypothetical protein
MAEIFGGVFFWLSPVERRMGSGAFRLSRAAIKNPIIKRLSAHGVIKAFQLMLFFTRWAQAILGRLTTHTKYSSTRLAVAFAVFYSMFT